MDDIFAVSEVRGIDWEQLLRGPPNISDNLRLPTLEAKASNKFRVKVLRRPDSPHSSGLC